MRYKIECVIKEIEIKNNGIILKIRGTDGYILSQDSRTYNVFFPEDLGKPKNLPPIIGASAIVLDADSLLFLKIHCFPLSHSFGSKVKIKFKSCVYNVNRKMYELKKSNIIFING